ncbi:MAG: aminotransferase class V-fold PLP-dependent enzyme [Gemmatimonadetes bacterium]|nr:aminotransferase class V-fold PLP-dependent enzyme [Gemmatimonadota bacterium]
MASRRDFVGSLLGASFGATLPSLRNDGLDRIFSATRSLGSRTPEEIAGDEEFWFAVQQAFTVDRSIINLNNGGVSPSPKVVQEALKRMIDFQNMAPAYTMWGVLEPEVESVRTKLAAAFGCDREEMAITRGASEALEIAQLGIDLKPGDEVLTTDQDYGRMINTWNQRVRREGIVLKQVSFPDPPPSMGFLVDMFAKAITPKTRVIHFCHITNLSGQIFPVKEICQMARARGIETVVDGAHAFAHFPFKRDDLDCDYYGTSLHKWLLAPIGTGFLYVRREKIKKLWPMMPAHETQDTDIKKFEEIGTHPAANHNAIAEALTFHDGIGGERKIARLRFLRDRWMKRLEGKPGVRLYTSYDPAMSGALSNIGLEGKEPGAITNYLWTNYRIMATPIGHKACTGIRVTPNVYTTLDEIDVFSAAMEKIISKGLV